MRISSSAACLLGSSLLAGCVVGPNYHRPASTAPAAFMGTTAVSARSTAPGSSADNIAWWFRFRDPVLTGLEEQAQVENLDVAQAIARVTQARADLLEADAALLPSGSITGSAAAQRLSQDTLQGRQLTAFGIGRDTAAYEGDLNAS